MTFKGVERRRKRKRRMWGMKFLINISLLPPSLPPSFSHVLFWRAEISVATIKRSIRTQQQLFSLKRKKPLPSLPKLDPRIGGKETKSCWSKRGTFLSVWELVSSIFTFPSWGTTRRGDIAGIASLFLLLLLPSRLGRDAQTLSLNFPPFHLPYLLLFFFWANAISMPLSSSSFFNSVTLSFSLSADKKR